MIPRKESNQQGKQSAGFLEFVNTSKRKKTTPEILFKLEGTAVIVTKNSTAILCPCALL